MADTHRETFKLLKLDPSATVDEVALAILSDLIGPTVDRRNAWAFAIRFLVPGAAEVGVLSEDEIKEWLQRRAPKD